MLRQRRSMGRGRAICPLPTRRLGRFCPLDKTTPQGQGCGVLPTARGMLRQEAGFGEPGESRWTWKKLPIYRADWAFHMAYIADLRGWRDGSIVIFCGSGIRIARGTQGEDVGVFPSPLK